MLKPFLFNITVVASGASHINNAHDNLLMKIFFGFLLRPIKEILVLIKTAILAEFRLNWDFLLACDTLFCY